eukprot:6197798-Pleurochrysis_carterae.AAC.6
MRTAPLPLLAAAPHAKVCAMLENMPAFDATLQAPNTDPTCLTAYGNACLTLHTDAHARTQTRARAHTHTPTKSHTPSSPRHNPALCAIPCTGLSESSSIRPGGGTCMMHGPTKKAHNASMLPHADAPSTSPTPATRRHHASRLD